MAGVLGSIMSMFSPGGGAVIQAPNPNPGIPATQNQPTGVNQPGQPMPGTHASPTTAPNGVVPAGGADSPTEPVNPLDKFADVWAPPKDAKPAETVADMFKNLDVKKLHEQAATVDFAKIATADDLKAIQAGGNEAATAMVSLMNRVAQAGYAQSAIATTKIVEQALTRAQEISSTQTAEAIRRAAVTSGIVKENPVLTHPVFQPVVGALQEQLSRKSPGATAEEINRQVLDAVGAMAAALNPKKADTTSKGGKSEGTDWEMFLNA